MRISIPNLSLVVLVGPGGSGKSTFAQQHFRTTEVLSSDFCRGLVKGKKPLRRVHECVFGVLALESEPVDPRL